MKSRRVAVFVSIVLFMGIVQQASAELYSGLVLSQDHFSIKIGDSVLSVGEVLELDRLLETLDADRVKYTVNNDFEYPFWGSREPAAARLVTIQHVRLVWLKELKILCSIEVSDRNVQSCAGLSVGMDIAQVYSLFGQTGPLNVSQLTLMTKEKHTFMGYESEIGFDYWITVFLERGRVRAFRLIFSEEAI